MEYPEATHKEDDDNPFPPPRFVNLDDIQPTYANFIHVLQDQYAFHLIFGQINPPIIRTDDDRQKLLQEGLAAKVVSRLVVTPNSLRDFIDYMSVQLERFESSQSTDDPE